MASIFRLLRADEIDCRIGNISEKGLSLLLYKDARCDMNILDETFGAFGWQRHHSRDNANCIVSIYDEAKGEWIEKEDTGTESNTEAEKGLASDSFKRACFNWGIGRELYTAPFIWINKDKCNIQKNDKGRWVCYDKFHVAEIGFNEEGKINKITIANQETDVFVYPRNNGAILNEKPQERKDTTQPVKTQETQEKPLFKCEKCGKVLTVYKNDEGQNVSIRKHAEGSMKKFGKVWCIDCINGYLGNGTTS